MTTDQHWRQQSACTPDDAWMFDYDPNKKAPERHVIASAKALCHSCPVLDVCALDTINYEAGASAKNRYEIVGGLTPMERADLDPKAGKRKASRPTASGINAPQPITRRTHCVRNHELTKANTYTRPGRTTPECATCANDNKRRSAARRAAREQEAS